MNAGKLELQFLHVHAWKNSSAYQWS